MDSHNESQLDLPEWISSINSPLWVTDPFGDICFINNRAQELLGYSLSDCIGKPCYRVISGKDSSGVLFCTPDCPVFDQAKRNRPIDPIDLKVYRSNGRIIWIHVLIITIKGSDPSVQWLLHCAMEDNRAYRIEEYLTRVLSRTPNHRLADQNLDLFSLTKRETEILLLLATDESLHAIAYKLHVSYATVRNHVHHILSKLGVHSVMEAVAHYLLSSADRKTAKN